MSYAIISVGGKQYRVSAGERLLVDRLALEDGATFTPTVLLTGGDGDPQIAPTGAVVTAKVVRHAKGPKIRIGKYKQRTGYKRHTGFRASLTQIEIESIGGKAKQEKPKTAKAAAEPAGLPEGYAELTVAEVKNAVDGWSATECAAALEYERTHAKRKGAIAALESATSEGGED
jgi:large subunit ribosomal protein L21